MNDSKQKSVRVEFDEADWEILRVAAFNVHLSMRQYVRRVTLAALAPYSRKRIRRKKRKT